LHEDISDKFGGQMHHCHMQMHHINRNRSRKLICMTSSGIQCYFCCELIKDDGDNDDDGDDDADTEKVRLFLPLTCHNLHIVL